MLTFSNAFSHAAEIMISRQEQSSSLPNDFILMQHCQSPAPPEKSLAVECGNACDWMVSRAYAHVTVSFSATGLPGGERNLFLYDSARLFYKPESAINKLDFSSCRRWEFRISVVIDIGNLFFKK